MRDNHSPHPAPGRPVISMYERLYSAPACIQTIASSSSGGQLTRRQEPRLFGLDSEAHILAFFKKVLCTRVRDHTHQRAKFSFDLVLNGFAVEDRGNNLAQRTGQCRRLFIGCSDTHGFRTNQDNQVIARTNGFLCALCSVDIELLAQSLNLNLAVLADLTGLCGNKVRATNEVSNKNAGRVQVDLFGGVTCSIRPAFITTMRSDIAIASD